MCSAKTILTPFFDRRRTRVDMSTPPATPVNDAGSNDDEGKSEIETSTHAEVPNEGTVSRVSMRIPPFWGEEVELWFSQVEAHFANSRISSDTSKYTYLVSGLEPRVLQQVRDVVVNPPTDGKYPALKRAILAAFGESSQQRIHKLLSGIELGDQKPSQLLNRMRSLAPKSVPDVMLKQIWLSRLDADLRTILSANDVALADLAVIADRVHEVNHWPRPFSIASVEVKAKAIQAEHNSKMESELAALTKRLDRLETHLFYGASTSRRSRSRGQHGSRAPSMQPKPSQTTVQTSKKLASAMLDNASSALVLSRLQIRDQSSSAVFLIDTGADVSVIPPTRHERLNPDRTTQLFVANGSTIKTFGAKRLRLNLGLHRIFVWNFIIAEVSSPIIGADLLNYYGLLVDMRGRKIIDPETSRSTVAQIRETNKPPTLSFRAFDQQSTYGSLLQQYREITNPRPRRNVKCVTTHHIVTRGPPVRAKVRRAEFDFLIDQGICRPSKSEWSSPLHMVRKPNGVDWRPCGDYRALNACTLPDRYPIGFLQDCTSALHGMKVFSVLDLHKAFHHVPVEPDDIPKTAIITPFGLFEFVYMTFGF